MCILEKLNLNVHFREAKFKKSNSELLRRACLYVTRLKQIAPGQHNNELKFKANTVLCN